MNRIFKIMMVSALLTFTTGAYAFQATSSTGNQTRDDKQYLSGKLLSWTDTTIVTSVGTYTIDQEVVVLDQIGTGKKTYTKDEVKPNVQLTFEENKLIKVVIYP